MIVTVTHDSDHHQFIAVVDGKIASLKYSLSADGKTIDYYSTFVPPELRGQGIAQSIVKFGLEYAKENNFRVIPSCSFVEAYIDLHPEYKDILQN